MYHFILTPDLFAHLQDYVLQIASFRASKLQDRQLGITVYKVGDNVIRIDLHGTRQVDASQMPLLDDDSGNPPQW